MKQKCHVPLQGGSFKSQGVFHHLLFVLLSGGTEVEPPSACWWVRTAGQANLPEQAA